MPIVGKYEPSDSKSGSFRHDLALAVPLAAMLAVLFYWAGDEGGFSPTVWYPGALIALGLLVICFADRRFSLEFRSWRTAALGLFALFTLWSFLSISWATVGGDAWDGANKTLLYLTIFAFFSRWATTPKVAASFAYLFALGVTVLGYVTIERALQSGDGGSVLTSWRLTEPIGYQNGEAALFLIPLWPALYLASRRELPALARGLIAGCAALLVQMAVLAQSRGSMYAFPIVFVIFLVLVTGRGRALVTALLVLAVSAPNLTRLLDVYRAGERGEDLGAALAQARTGMVLVFFAALVVGTALAFLDRKVSLPERASRRLERGVVAGFSAVVLIAGVIAVGSVDHPIGRAQNAWHNFQTGGGGGEASSHFTSLYGTNRYDFWRVSMSQFREHPIGGVGSGNFSTEYLRSRRSVEETTDPHSIEIKILLQTGVIGALLFAGFLVSALIATRWRRPGAAAAPDQFSKGLSMSLVAGFAYWLVHGSVEWFWEIPAITAAALAFLGLATALAARGEAPEPSPQSREGRQRLLLLAPLAVVALISSVSFGAPWLSARYVDSASHSWRSHPEDAYEMLDRARSLNPLSENPDVIAGTIASRRRDFDRMKVAYLRSLNRNPLSWYARFELGIAEYQTGRRDAALDQLERARSLNPGEPVIREILKSVRAREEIDLAALDRAFLERALLFSADAN